MHAHVGHPAGCGGGCCSATNAQVVCLRWRGKSSGSPVGIHTARSALCGPPAGEGRWERFADKGGESEYVCCS